MATIQVFFGAELQGGCLLDDKLEATVGRAAGNDIVIDNAAVSRLHCTLKRVNRQWTVVDAGSANGIFVNGERIQSHVLRHQDRVVVGKHTLLFNQYGGDVGEEGANTGEEAAESTVFLGRDALARMKQRSRSQQSMALVLTGQQRRVIPLDGETVLIGRGGHCELRIGGLFVKSVQALVMRTDMGHRIIHQGGLRGMSVNGTPCREAVLRAGDTIVIAGNRISYGSL